MHIYTTLLALTITGLLSLSGSSMAQQGATGAFTYYSNVKVPTFNGYGNTRFYSAVTGQYMIQMPNSNVLGTASTNSPILPGSRDASNIVMVSNQLASNYIYQVRLLTNAKGGTSCLTYVKGRTSGEIQRASCARGLVSSQAWVIRYVLGSQQVIGWTFSPENEQRCLAPATNTSASSSSSRAITPLTLVDCNRLDAIWASEAVGIRG